MQIESRLRRNLSRCFPACQPHFKPAESNRDYGWAWAGASVAEFLSLLRPLRDLR